MIIQPTLDNKTHPTVGYLTKICFLKIAPLSNKKRRNGSAADPVDSLKLKIKIVVIEIAELFL